MIMKTEVLAAALNSIRTKKSCEERLHSSKRLSVDFPIMIDDASSDDVYYRSESSVGNIPFMWESQPGTPKYKSSWRPESPLLIIPPLTPPPSFHSSPAAVSAKKNNSRRRKKNNNLVPSVNLLPKLKLNHNHQSPTRSTSSSSWSTSSSSPLSSSGTTPKQRRVRSSSSPRRETSSFDDSRIEEQEGESCAESPVSGLSFGGGGDSGGRSISGRSSGCYSSIIRLLYAR